MEVKTYTIDEIKNIVTPIAEEYQIAQVYLCSVPLPEEILMNRVT